MGASMRVCVSHNGPAAIGKAMLQSLVDALGRLISPWEVRCP